MSSISNKEALTRVENRLAECERHLTNARLLPGQQRELLATAVTSLKSIWNILNNMEKNDSIIAAWFRELSETAKSDPLLSFFTTERNLIMKEGIDSIKGVSVRARPGAMARTGPNGFTFRWPSPEHGMLEVLVPRPTNAISSFMGDAGGGGMGYIVELPDGTQAKQYVQVPPECAQVTLYYSEAPLEHLGQQLATREADVLVGLYHAFWSEACKELRDHLTL